ncbi:hypothetical protein HY500_03540 [Candidatus Woesearchaeota archaeon]|nr:hypothetical protein [Candidatus Woesearchaeota archaeon]
MKRILIVFLLIFIIGCGQPGQGRGKITGEPDGLQISFLPLQPASSLRENQDVNVGLELVNNGVCDISSEVCVTDTLSSVWAGVEEQCTSLELRGIEQVGEGVTKDSTTKQFSFPAYRGVDRDLSTSIIAKSKYNCDITAGPQLCVKPLVGQKEKECPSFEKITGDKLRATIAPITLVGVDKQLVPEQGGIKLVVAITLKKMGAGEIKGELDESTINKKGSSSALRYVPVRVEVDYRGYGSLECRELENGIFLWRKDKDQEILNCEIFLGSIDYVENPLDIKLGYEYEVSQMMPIQILDVDKQR